MATGAFDFQYANTKEIRDLFSDYANMWRKLPIVSLIMNPGTYTWILILFCGFLFYQKRGRGALVLAAPFLNVAVCIASPVNGLLRYAMPLAACLPCIIFWCVFYGKSCTGQPLVRWDFDKEGDRNG